MDGFDSGSANAVNQQKLTELAKEMFLASRFIAEARIFRYQSLKRQHWVLDFPVFKRQAFKIVNDGLCHLHSTFRQNQ